MHINNIYTPVLYTEYKASGLIDPNGMLINTATETSASVAYTVYSNCFLKAGFTYHFTVFNWSNITYINACLHGTTNVKFVINETYKHMEYTPTADEQIDFFIYINNKSANAQCRLCVTENKAASYYVPPCPSSNLTDNLAYSLQQSADKGGYTNFNHIVNLGLYFVNNTNGNVLHAPSSGMAFNVMVIKPTYDNAYVSQVAFSYSESRMWYRSYNPNTKSWLAWCESAHK